MSIPPARPHIEIQTRAFHLSDGTEQMPCLYASLPADADPEHAAHLVTLPLRFGLARFTRQGVLYRAGDGWMTVFDFTEDPPMLSVTWPGLPMPLIYGVRKDSPKGWAWDAVTAGHIGLILGPALDWDAIVAIPDHDPAAGTVGIMTSAALLDALAGRLAVGGIVPTMAFGAIGAMPAGRQSAETPTPPAASA